MPARLPVLLAATSIAASPPPTYLPLTHPCPAASRLPRACQSLLAVAGSAALSAPFASAYFWSWWRDVAQEYDDGDAESSLAQDGGPADAPSVGVGSGEGVGNPSSPAHALRAQDGAPPDAPQTQDDGAPQTQDGDPAGAPSLNDGFQELVDWFRSNGGTVDDRITIGLEPGTNVRGMIAAAPIPADTILIHTPRSLVLSSAEGGQCRSIAAIADELQLGDQSWWHSYFAFDTSAGERIPSQWDRSTGPGGAIAELQGLPPSGSTHRHVDWYQSACKKNGAEMTEVDWRALMLYLSRAADVGLVPIYDLMNHDNGRVNTVILRDGSGGLSVSALTDIDEGEPIYTTYSRSGDRSTSDVWDSYGFVEEYPQLWRWKDDRCRGARYGKGTSEPLSDQCEVLALSPTLMALSPTKRLVHPVGSSQRPLEEWQDLIARHHFDLRSSHVKELHDSARAILDGLPTTIEDDEALILDKRRLLGEDKTNGRDMNKADALQAMEYRLAFKKALRLAVEVAAGAETFLNDAHQLEL